MISVWFKNQATGLASVTLKSDPELQSLTRDEMLQKLDERDPWLLNKVWMFSKTLPNTKAFWRSHLKTTAAAGELWDPRCYTYWVSQSIADTHLEWLKSRMPNPTQEIASPAARNSLYPAHSSYLYTIYMNITSKPRVCG